MILLYELRLLPYVEIIPMAWYYIISTFLCFLFGIITIHIARKTFSYPEIENEEFDASLTISADNGISIKYALIVFSTISLLGALQHWYILLDMYGSITGVFINALKIYVKNTSGGGIEGQLPFVSNFGYVGIFWSAVYTAFRGRFNFLTFYPFIGVIIKEVSTLGRAGMLLALIEFLFAFILIRQMLSNDSKKRFTFSKRNGSIAVILLLAILIVSASLVKVSRVSFEQYQGASSLLRNAEGNPILSPSIYLYFSAHLGVLSQYLSKETEYTPFAQNSFLPAYNFLDRLDIVKRPSAYQKGYFIPMWVNTGTYIRELHADFGIIGLFLIPYSLG
ncbi:MAG: oligosaccharide repeat unit polymerase, partial [bacterium]